MNYLSNCDRYGGILGDAATFFRQIALEIDEKPDRISQHKSHHIIDSLVLTQHQSPLERVRTYEALSYGDAGVLLACPGASLSGIVINEIGSTEQRDLFYQYVLKEKAHTFLAVTEPNFGSNVSSLKTQFKVDALTKPYGKLNGEKWLVGHGATGTIGIVLLKVNDGPLGMRAILLTQEQLKNSHTIQRMVLPMVGLHGARLGRLIFKDHIVDPDYLLGTHLKAMEHGIMALIKTFNQMRPCIGAMALGTAQAIIDYFYASQFPMDSQSKKIIRALNQSISMTRDMLYEAARRVEEDPRESGHSSLTKFKATRLAEEVAETVSNIVGKKCFIEHPILEKWYRDVWGFEYMEGTQNIHRINVSNAYQNGKIQLEPRLKM